MRYSKSGNEHNRKGVEMIRFCDREVGCVEYNSINRDELLSYFLSGHLEDIIMVFDSFSTMEFIGKITYRSLLYAININSAIQSEFVILNQNMWKRTREIFDKNRGRSGIDALVPVLNDEYHLICFAYEDDDANREIRMLRELSENPNALQFTDVYPEYCCVIIHGFNELAYLFAIYLKSINISVQVDGAMWQNFFCSDECDAPDYACMMVYAEGVVKKKQSLLENKLRSVSVEFECIDQIYELNIKNDIIKNTNRNLGELIEDLKNEKEIVILGTGIESQKAYGYLKKNGVNVFCFMGQESHRMFGKEILPYLEIRKTCKFPVYIDCESKGSVWGGQVDYYDYIGYERNKEFILLKDYVEIPDTSLVDAVKNRKVLLIGDCYLCQRLCVCLIRNGVLIEGQLVMSLKDNELKTWHEEEHIDYSDQHITWLIVVPIVYDRNTIWERERTTVADYCDRMEINDFTDCFSNIASYICVESENITIKKSLNPKKIILGSIINHSGNVFFREVLDNHPSILMIGRYRELNNNLLWICISLSTIEANDILTSFWRIFKDIAIETIYNEERFNEKMSQLLKIGERFTAHELFVMFHIAYAYMFKVDVVDINIQDMVIYWEPHYMPREILEDCAKWLGGGKQKNISCDIVNVVRNLCVRAGSQIKDQFMRGMTPTRDVALRYYSIDQKSYDEVERVVVKFEDLKCNPKKTLLTLCKKWGISWFDSFMETTVDGRKSDYDSGEYVVSDYDLKPVYNTYEKYLSEFDRLRIVMMNAPWQERYGYPYVELTRFSRRELQEMFLKPFRFEELEEIYKDEELLIRMQQNIREWMQKARMESLCEH